MKKFLLPVTCFFLSSAGVLGVSGCASLGTYNPATGKNEFIAISTTQEVQMGRDVHKSIEKQYEFSTNQAKITLVNALGQRLIKVSDRQDFVYKFYVIEKDELNAFTTPGGNIYIFTGLLDKLPSEDAIASVLAHEIGHSAAKHTVKKFQAALGYSLVGSIVLSQIAGDGARQLAQMSTNTIMNLVFSAYGRQDEYEADRLGVRYMVRAGLNPHGSVEALNFLLEASKGDAQVPAILRTHPHLADRIEAVKREIKLAKQ